MLIHLSITSGVQYLESVPVVHTDKNHHYYKQTFACTANPIVSKFTFRGNISKVLKPGSGSGLFDKKIIHQCISGKTRPWRQQAPSY